MYIAFLVLLPMPSEMLGIFCSLVAGEGLGEVKGALVMPHVKIKYCTTCWCLCVGVNVLVRMHATSQRIARDVEKAARGIDIVRARWRVRTGGASVLGCCLYYTRFVDNDRAQVISEMTSPCVAEKRPGKVSGGNLPCDMVHERQ